MKEVSRNSEVIRSNLTRKIVINTNVISVEKWIMSPLNNFFINICPKLADDITTAVRYLESYVKKTNEKMKDKPITIKELIDPFFLSKQIKALHLQCCKNCFAKVCDRLKHIFYLSFKKGIFPDFIKIVKVSLFKGSDNANLS